MTTGCHGLCEQDGVCSTPALCKAASQVQSSRCLLHYTLAHLRRASQITGLTTKHGYCATQEMAYYHYKMLQSWHCRWQAVYTNLAKWAQKAHLKEEVIFRSLFLLRAPIRKEVTGSNCIATRNLTRRGRCKNQHHLKLSTHIKRKLLSRIQAAVSKQRLNILPVLMLNNGWCGFLPHIKRENWITYIAQSTLADYL